MTAATLSPVRLLPFRAAAPDPTTPLVETGDNAAAQLASLSRQNKPPALSSGAGIRQSYPDGFEPLLAVVSSVEAHQRITGGLPSHLECSPAFLAQYCASIGLDWPPVYYSGGMQIRLIPVASLQDWQLISYSNQDCSDDWWLL